MASALIHLSILGAIVIGGARQLPSKPLQQGPGANASDIDSEPMATLILINEPISTTSSDEPMEPAASSGTEMPQLLVAILSPDPLPAPPSISIDDDTNATEDAQEAADQVGRALLFGRYSGQVKARILRAWQRPRTPIGADTFTCHVQIKQDRQGAVQEITLTSCNGDARWQVSLASAIQAVSPLPAPPDPSVFVDAMALSFVANAFHEGSDAQEYEPERVVVADVAPASSTSGFSGDLAFAEPNTNLPSAEPLAIPTGENVISSPEPGL